MNVWNDPNRWVHADHQRNAWLRYAAWRLAAATVITAVVLVAGIVR